jgi:2'-5' RNA ligase
MTMARATETAVVVPVPAAEPVVAGHRRRLDVAASWGVGAHVSVLYPFAPPSVVDDALIARLDAALRVVPAFDCAFERCEWFGDDVLWVAPEPAQPFRALTTAVWREFPEYPPYGGAHDDPVPHLTVGESRRGTRADLERAEAEVSPQLPVRTHIDRVVLLAGTSEPDSWRPVRHFALRPQTWCRASPS